MSDSSAALDAIRTGYTFDVPAIDLGSALDGDTAVTDARVRLPLGMLNRHGLVAGATGTGKTVTLQVLAQAISDAGVPVFAADILLTGPWGLGLLRSAPAVGALGMSFLLAYVSLNRHVGRIMFGSVALFGVATIAFGLSTSLWFSLATLVVLGAADMVSVVIRSSFVQLETPDAMRGRVSAVNGLFIGASNQLGEFESGVTAHFFGTVPAVVLGGVGTLVITGVWMKLFPGLARRHRLTEPRQDS